MSKLTVADTKLCKQNICAKGNPLYLATDTVKSVLFFPYMTVLSNLLQQTSVVITLFCVLNKHALFCSTLLTGVN